MGIQAREEARCAKDFAMADNVREQLRTIGVEIWDKEKTWKQESTGLRGVVLRYFGDRPPSDLEISTLMIQRERARLKKDFEMSDTIRDELKERGVFLFDKDREWKTSDGRRGTIPSFNDVDTGLAVPGRSTTAAPVAAASQGGAGGDLQTQLLQLAVSQPAIAPQILAILPQVAGKPGAAPQRASPGVPTKKPASALPFKVQTGLPTEVQQAVTLAKQSSGRRLNDSEISYLVQTRENSRKARDFSSADLLRTQMKEVGVEIYDKEKMWKTSDGRQGTVPSWS